MSDAEPIAPGALEFNGTASSYEKGNGGCTTAIAERLAELSAPLSNDSYVLDCAAGPGVVIDALLHREDSAANNARYVVVEPAPNMMKTVRRKIANQWDIPSDKISTFINAAEDLGSLGLGANKFSHVFCSCGIMFFSDPEGGARNMYELLKPGGTAYIVTFANIGYMQPATAACLKVRPSKEPFKLFTSDEWYDSSYLEQLVRKAGFRDVKMETVDCPLSRPSLPVLADSVIENFQHMWKEEGWTEPEWEGFVNCLDNAIAEDKENVTFDKTGVHVNMQAHIAICKK